jgi:segregation and condensation protein B
MTADPHIKRMVEALLFAAEEPLDEASLAKRLPEGVDLAAALEELRGEYETRGVLLDKVAGRWAFFTAPDMAFLLQEHRQVVRKLSRAALETLAIISYHQPITRAEIESVRGVSLSRGTLELLLETGWIRMRGRRRTPGRPLTYGTTDDFLIHFSLDQLSDLPGVAELKAAGLLEIQAPSGMQILPLGGVDGNGAEDPLTPDDDGSDLISDLLSPEPNGTGA